MKLLFQQRESKEQPFFAIRRPEPDFFDVFDELGEKIYLVRSDGWWSTSMDVSDASGNYVGKIDQAGIPARRRFDISTKDGCIGSLRRRGLIKYELDINGWTVSIDSPVSSYNVTAPCGRIDAVIVKECEGKRASYTLDVVNPGDALLILMITLAIHIRYLTKD